MSASEKLKALGPRALDALDELSGDAGWAHAYQPGGEDAPDREPDVRAVLNALPQIVAVVEAAEMGRANWVFTARLAAALTALEEALS